jgi:cytochrome P450
MACSRYSDVRATLADPRFTVPTPEPTDAPTGVAWLRSNVARFSTGPAHTRRRTSAIDQLSTVDPQALRKTARTRTTTWLAAAGTAPVDLMSIARALPTELLSEALGLPGINPTTVAAIARAYPTGAADRGQNRPSRPGLRRHSGPDRQRCLRPTARCPGGPRRGDFCRGDLD